MRKSRRKPFIAIDAGVILLAILFFVLTGDGSGKARPAVYKAKKQECDGRPYSFGYDLPPYGVAVFEF